MSNIIEILKISAAHSYTVERNTSDSWDPYSRQKEVALETWNQWMNAGEKERRLFKLAQDLNTSSLKKIKKTVFWELMESLHDLENYMSEVDKKEVQQTVAARREPVIGNGFSIAM